jgi:hypothetical protein
LQLTGSRATAPSAARLIIAPARSACRVRAVTRQLEAGRLDQDPPRSLLARPAVDRPGPPPPRQPGQRPGLGGENERQCRPFCWDTGTAAASRAGARRSGGGRSAALGQPLGQRGRAPAPGQQSGVGRRRRCSASERLDGRVALQRLLQREGPSLAFVRVFLRPSGRSAISFSTAPKT